MNPEVRPVGASAIAQHPVWGYYHLDPIPDAGELSRFYESRYADLVQSSRRAPDLRRLLRGGPEADAERHWIWSTLYSDIGSLLDAHFNISGRKLVLDIGTGTGELVEFLTGMGWQAIGIEPSSKAVDVGQRLGRPVRAATLEEFIGQRAVHADAFGCITALNVLEHVPDPEGFITSARELLTVDGLLIVRVPNDFSVLQRAAARKLNKDAWWIAVPDHISYFGFSSLSALLTGSGFDIVDRLADFPMELFLLLGDDYLDDLELGGRCHAKRREFELALDPEVRRKWARSLAAAEFGRNCLIVARRAQ